MTVSVAILIYYRLYACFLLQCLCEYEYYLFCFILIKLIYPVLILNFYVRLNIYHSIFLSFIYVNGVDSVVNLCPCRFERALWLRGYNTLLFGANHTEACNC